MVHIVDYGACNVGSIRNMLKKVGVETTVARSSDELRDAKSIVLPGVGAFDAGMERLEQSRMIDVLNEKAFEERVPILGICLGMQILTGESEEGERPGLGWIDARTVRFDFSAIEERPRIPHMGWNTIRATREDELLAGFDTPPRFYFVHSYHVVCERPDDVIATCDYGFEFTSVVRRGNILGTQFHPEKSHRFGMKVLENFSRIPVTAQANAE